MICILFDAVGAKMRAKRVPSARRGVTYGWSNRIYM